MNLATYITCLRIFLILPIAYLTSLNLIEYDLLAMVLFIFAGFTDYLDGYVARKTNTASSLGALLDLLADKLLVCLILIWLININDNIFLVIPSLVIISRELIISSIRQFIVERKKTNNLKISLIAKSKTTVQFLAISMLIVSPQLGVYFINLSIITLWIAALISIISLYTSLRSWQHLLD